MAARKKKTEPATLDFIAEPLRPLAEPLDAFQADPNNAREHDEANLAAIRYSLERYGQRKPIVANRATGQVEAGNGTLEAARGLGWSHLAVVWVDDDPRTASGFSLADNRSAELAAWDEIKLTQLLTQDDTAPDLEFFAQLGWDDLLEDRAAALTADDAEEEEREVTAWEVVVTCADEDDCQAFCDQMQAENRSCRLLTSKR